jgi:hypothetical protein
LCGGRQGLHGLGGDDRSSCGSLDRPGRRFAHGVHPPGRRRPRRSHGPYVHGPSNQGSTSPPRACGRCSSRPARSWRPRRRTMRPGVVVGKTVGMSLRRAANRHDRSRKAAESGQLDVANTQNRGAPRGRRSADSRAPTCHAPDSDGRPDCCQAGSTPAHRHPRTALDVEFLGPGRSAGCARRPEADGFVLVPRVCDHSQEA